MAGGNVISKPLGIAFIAALLTFAAQSTLSQSLQRDEPAQNTPPMPYQGPHIHATDMTAPAKAHWELTVASGQRCLVQLGYSKSANAAEVIQWDQWATRLLHMVYANLCTMPGEQNLRHDFFRLYVRADGAIKVADDAQYSGNLLTLKRAVEVLSGRPELKFPEPSPTGDTISITGNIYYGPRQVSQDVWGRAVSSTSPFRSEW